MSVLVKIWEKLFRTDGKHGYTCDCCGDELFDYPASRICDNCNKHIEYNDTLICEKCGRKTVSQGVCTSCKRILPTFTLGISPLTYRGETASLVNRLKNGDRRLAFFFAQRMTKSFLNRFPMAKEKDLLIIPVPLTDEKRRARGYNQAETLAFCFADALKGAGITATLDYDVLQKTRDNDQQKHLSIAERFQNADGTYHLHKRKICKGKTVILVDDILTTGATGSACAKLLLNAHVDGVILLTVASLVEQN